MIVINPPAPLIGLIPTALLAADDAVAGDPWGLVTQLGIGGFLVGFAVWLQDKFSAASRRDSAETKAEAKAEAERHEVEMAVERDRHDVTRAALIAALTKKKDD